MDGDVTVRVEWSTLNYKDGLAITGGAPVVRRFPMIPGIDFAGTVESVDRIRTGRPGDQGDPQRLGLRGNPPGRLWREGAGERATGWCGCPSMSAREAMAIGTAGYTAMLAVMALEGRGLTPRAGRCSSPVPRAASARSQLQFFRSVVFRSQPRRAARRRPTT